MQLPAWIPHGSYGELTGWGLVRAGMALAGWTLGERQKPRPAATLGPVVLRPAAAQDHRVQRRIDPADAWQRLLDIAEGGHAVIDAVTALHLQAWDEVAAADQAVSELLADCATALKTLQSPVSPRPPRQSEANAGASTKALAA